MIGRAELLLYFNRAPTFGARLDRVNAFADLLGDGSITTKSDLDTIIAVAIGANVTTPLTLPPASA